MTDQEIEDLNRGVILKVLMLTKAYEVTDRHRLLSFTIKGYGIGSRQADNTTHQVKKLSLDNLREFKII